MTFPTRFVKYLSANNSFIQKKKNQWNVSASSHLSPIFNDAADIIEAEGIPTFGIEQNQLHGRSIASKADALADAMKIEGWKYIHCNKERDIDQIEILTKFIVFRKNCGK